MASLADDAANARIGPISPPPPATAPFPVKTKQVAAVIDGIHTEFIMSVFSDRIMISITQLNKLGTVVSACLDLSFEALVL